MPARYVLRFDDLCPAMNWRVWERIERVLRGAGVCPLVSVVPDNRDPSLEIDPPRGSFWERVRTWADWGWTIGMHGYQHIYRTRVGGVVGLGGRSEFAGLGCTEQRRMLEASAAIFARHGVEPRAWVAPGHSFDQTTLGLLPEIGIGTVSDGLFLAPRTDRRGLLWIPQQLWRFRSFPFGIWTVCLHPNRWDAARLEQFERDLGKYRGRIASVPEIAAACRGRRSASLGGIVPALMRRSIQFRCWAGRPAGGGP